MRTCADCSKEFHEKEMYMIDGPRAPALSERSVEFWLCIPCWDNLVGAATMQAVR